MTARLQRNVFDNHRRNAGACDDDIGNSGNRNGNHCGAVERRPVGDLEWTNHVGIHRTFGYKSQNKNVAELSHRLMSEG